MIRLIFLFAVLGLGLFVGTQYTGQQGYVLISIANHTLEMSVTTLVIFIIAALAGLFALEWAVKKILRTGFYTWNWFSVRKQRHSRRYTNQAIIKLLEGDWAQAEKKATRWANYHDMPLLCYLTAAEAAHGMGNHSKRDHYLALAAKQPHATLAVELTRAKQQISEGDHAAALNTLTQLEQSYSQHPLRLRLLQQCYQALAKWQAQLDLLPQLTKAKLITNAEAQQLEQTAQAAMVHEVASQQGHDGLVQYWSKMPSKLKTDPDLLASVIPLFIQYQADEQAFSILKPCLNKHNLPALYALLPQLNLSDRQPLIRLLQQTLQRDQHNAPAHSALGQLYLREAQWADAQHHLEQALSLRSDVSDYAYLAEALDQQTLTRAAHDVARKALSLLK
ncbi:heme biosynthesis protein HemY [Vibrio sp. HDW18]|uniref:heme biosynthesis protein HemY n=1 Tax=Vibrio sp. HDW18 TaxID=2714948 RepID=UPI00140D8FA5|nr:heme biosynthesis HemY N-terminal domain-containing protein [Vibrio sp. HDW18]QIL85547.1 heme biosynthesis protein HemY [Vibrio sp. HDW18]